MKDLLHEANSDRDIYTLGKICSELRSSIIGGFARDSATLKLSDVREIYCIDEDMARAVIDTLVSEQYLSLRSGDIVYTVEYNTEELKFLTKRRRFLEGETLKICLAQQSTSLHNQQYKYKELLRVYQSGKDISSANIAYFCSLFQILCQRKFEEIEFVLRAYNKYLQLYWKNLSNYSAYLHALKQFNDSCIEHDSTSAEKLSGANTFECRKIR